MRAFALADPPVWVTWKVVAVPAGSSFQSYGKGDAVLLGGGGMRVGGISGAFGCGLGQRADCSGRLLGFACERACCVFAIRGLAKLAWLISVVGLFCRGVLGTDVFFACVSTCVGVCGWRKRRSPESQRCGQDGREQNRDRLLYGPSQQAKRSVCIGNAARV